MVSLPALLLALLSGSPTVVPADGPVWVFFADKAVADPGPALAERRRGLAARALARRVRTRGDAGVDLRDLPPAPAYVAAVLATGARLRASSRWLNAVSVDASATQRAAIARLPQVQRLRRVARGQRSAGDLPLAPAPAPIDGVYLVGQAQLDRLGVPTLHECGLTGAGVVVGVQDTGFALTHQAFAGATVLAARDFVHDDDIVADEDGDAEKQDHHGTAVLSLVVGRDGDNFSGVAPGVSLLLAKTEDVSSETPVEEDYYVEGLEWIEGMGADIFTASLGYIDWYKPEQLDGKTTVVAQAAAIAIANGLIMFAPTGNNGPNAMTLISPSDVDGIIAIGATNVDGVLAGFSSRGPTADGRIKPDLLAPGEGVWGVAPDTLDQYAAQNGTSLATPLAAGVGALLKQAYPQLGPAEMLALLRDTAVADGPPESDHGWGMIDGPAAAGLYCTCVDADKDGHFAARCGGDDCDDSDATVYPGAPELCDGADNDCDLLTPPGEQDADLDGARLCANDCDDANAARYPGAPELADCIDTDCDGFGSDDCEVGTTGPTPSTTSSGGDGELPTTDALSTGGGAAGSSTGPEPPGQDIEVGCQCAAGPGGSARLLLLLACAAPLARRRRRHP
ncbi:MAG: S8 family serine peptidase [Nannocystis sp.]|uniref:S8 family serine peptidase n=1 Tax=Nannocystis sp. TaxID=1962667 RepID=UPI0024285722|nr:S8 family serine peptidase [Nannocystis sp.]MBK9756445.1 S8 family serine peptidase [Nannocystis sp.]